MSLTVHGDDFLITGSLKNIDWLGERFKQRYEIKFNKLGPEPGSNLEISILNRVIRWGENGIEYESDQRHAEAIVEELGLSNSRNVSTPGTTDSRVDDQIEDGELDAKGASQFRSVAARCNFLAQDRTDIQYASKETSKFMSKPTQKGLESVKRIGRYLKGAPRLVQHFNWEAGDDY